MYEDDVSTHAASPFFACNHPLELFRKFNRGGRAGAVTSCIIIVVAAITTHTTGVVVGYYTVPTPCGAAGVTSIVVCILV